MELKQAIIINSDLKMGTGKIAVQVGHGEVMYMQEVMAKYKDTTSTMIERFYDWKEETPDDQLGLMKKVVLRATEFEIINLSWTLKNKGIWAYPVFDRGLTQVPKDSLTCLVVEPISEEEYDKLFRHLKLL